MPAVTAARTPDAPTRRGHERRVPGNLARSCTSGASDHGLRIAARSTPAQVIATWPQLRGQTSGRHRLARSSPRRPQRRDHGRPPVQLLQPVDAADSAGLSVLAAPSVGRHRSGTTPLPRHARACAGPGDRGIVTSTSATALRPAQCPQVVGIANRAPYKAARKTRSTTSGSRWTSGRPGTNPSRAPPTTSTIGYGTDTCRASALRPATTTRSPRSAARRAPSREYPRPPPAS